MALAYSRLGGDEAGVVLGQLCNALTALFSRARGKMTLSKLSEDEQRIIFSHLCSVLEPSLAVYFSSASRGLWEQTQALRQQLRADHEAVAAMCLKVGIRSKELRRRWRLSGVVSTICRRDHSVE